MAALSAEQKRKARAKIAAKRGTVASSVTDSDITYALSIGLISMSDCGSSSGYHSSYDSSSSYDSGCDGGGGGGE